MREVRIYLVRSQGIASRHLLGLLALPLSIITGSSVTQTQTACSVQNTQNFTARHRGPHLSCRLMLLSPCADISSLTTANNRPLCVLCGVTMVMNPVSQPRLHPPSGNVAKGLLDTEVSTVSFLYLCPVMHRAWLH